MRQLNFVAMVAAAGLSKRFGSDKALACVSGRPSAEHSAYLLSQIWPRKMYVTLPNHLLFHQTLQTSLNRLGALTIPNLFPKLGYAGSIKSVLTINQDESDGMIVTAVDSPIFSKRLLVLMLNVATFFWGKPTIIVPYFYFYPGHPVYVSKEFFDELRRGKHRGLDSVIAANKQWAHALFYPDTRILLNMNMGIIHQEDLLPLQLSNQNLREY